MIVGEEEEEEEGTEKENQAVKRGHAQVADMEDSGQRKRQAGQSPVSPPSLVTASHNRRSWREILGRSMPKAGSNRVSTMKVSSHARNSILNMCC